MKKLLTLMFVTAAVSAALGANFWTGAGSDDLWTNPNNWSGTYPDTSNQLKVQGDGEIVEVVPGNNISVNRMIWIDNYGAPELNNTTTTVNFSGGTFSCSGYWMMGGFSSTSTDPNQGVVFNVYGDTEVNANSMSLGIYEYALVNMNIYENASVNVSATDNSNYRYKGFVIPGDLGKDVLARVNISGSGELSVNNLVMGEGEDVYIDISGNGVLKVNGDVESSEIQPLITAGQITTDDGTTTPIVSYDGTWTLVRSENNSAFLKPNTPSPSDGQAVNTIVNASWVPGNPGTTWNLYLGTDSENLEIVEAGLTNPEYQFTDLEFGTDYYWRVDELNGGTTVQGDVWSFSTRTFFQVFWFEYADQSELETDWTASNSTIAPETAIARGSASMALSYDLSASPYISSAVSTDFPFEGNIACTSAYSMSVWIYGDVNNSDEEVFVSLTDGVNTATAVCDVPYVTQKAEVEEDDSLVWTRWYIDLRDFTDDNPSIDMGAITSMTIGVGDGTAGGSGTIYIDNVNLYPVSCIDSPEYDLNDDCKVDLADFALFSTEWLVNGNFPIIEE